MSEEVKTEEVDTGAKRKAPEKVKTEEVDTGAKRKAPEKGGNLNEGFTAVLIQLSDYEKNVARNMFKSKAYKQAAHSIAQLDYKLKSGKEAMKLKGIGKQIGLKLDEYLKTGGLAKIARIEGDDTSTAIALLTRVNGIGPAAARTLVDKGITTLEQLAEIKDTLSHAQQVGLKYFKDFEVRIPRAEIDDFKTALTECFAKYDDQLKFLICGSYRRGKESSFDVDMLMCHPDYTSCMKEPPNKMLKAVVEHLSEEQLLVDNLSVGTVKYMGCGKLPTSPMTRRIDIRIVPHDRYWCGVLYFTGSEIFNQQMRTYALKKGFTLNEYTLRPVGALGVAGEPLEVSCEEDVFDYLELEYQAPKERTKMDTPKGS